MEEGDDEDESLPEVFPPYLPEKEDDGRIYTLVLDLDETLIHFEDVRIPVLNFCRKKKTMREKKRFFIW